MRVAEWMAPGDLRVVERPDPVAVEGQIVLKVTSCGICGSDLHSYQSGFAAVRGQVLGHEFCGTVVQAPGAENIHIGQRVVVRPLIPCGRCDRCIAGDIHLCESTTPCDIGYGAPGAFAEQVLVPRAILNESVFLLPDSVDDRGGSLVEPLSVALRSARLADCMSTDVALVIGGGTIGQGVVLFLRLLGVGMIVVSEPSALRRKQALAQGADVVIDPTTEDPVERLREITGRGSYGLGARVDVVVDCAGVEASINDALKCIRRGGKLVMTAVYGKQMSVSLDRIVEKELNVKGSFGYRDEFSDVIDFIADGVIDVDQFISHTFPLQRIDEAFKTQLNRDESLKVLVAP